MMNLYTVVVGVGNYLVKYWLTNVFYQNAEG